MTSTTTRRAALGATLLAGAAVLPAAARSPAPRAAPSGEGWTLPLSQVVPFTSAINGVAYELLVRPPVGHDPATETCPVIVTLDADYSFAIAANHLEHLAARQNQGPRAILVSVAYPGDYPDGRGYRLNRSRDYTPVFQAEGGYGPEYQRASGGGPAFLRVLTEEVLPLVRERWNADPEDHTLIGHSFGGLFAAWTLQTRPEAFRRYLMVSPSLWYADGLVLTREAAGTAPPVGRKTFAYLGVGALEQQPDNHPMVSQMQAFADMLTARGDPDLIVKSRVFEDETHASIFPACFSTGIRHLFGTMDPG